MGGARQPRRRRLRGCLQRRKPDDQWPGSRAIAAEKANTANALSLNGFALSTANLYAGAQPGGSLFGLALSAPPNPAVLYSGDPTQFGSASDPFVGKSLGGVIMFGGGLPFTMARASLAALAPAATLPALIITSPGACVRRWVWTRSPRAWVRTTMMKSSMISLPTNRALPATATPYARVRSPRSRSKFMQALFPAGQR